MSAFLIGMKMLYKKLLKNLLPVTDIKKYRKFLFIAAHAGDLAKAAGGTISKFSELGKEIKILITTDSTSTINDNVDMEKAIEKRRKEELASATILGVKEVEFLNNADGKYCDKNKLEKEILEVISAYKPDVIFLDSIMTPNELMSGDIITSKAVVSAVEAIRIKMFSEKENMMQHRIKALVFYNAVKANYYINIFGKTEKKLNAIMVHESLLPKNPEEKFSYMRSYRSLIRLSALINGLKSGKLYTEGFYVVSGNSAHNMPEINL